MNLLVFPNENSQFFERQWHARRYEIVKAIEYSNQTQEQSVPSTSIIPLPKINPIIKKTVKKDNAHWRLFRVISGHTGWVRTIAVDPSNQWFATGAADRLIKIWDLASGELKLTLTGHISSIRGLAISSSRPYLFSAGEDKMIKCWDLETNKVVRHYHGHLSGIYALSLHPALDILATGGRDSVVRLWDIRTRAQIHVLAGHNSTVSSLAMQSCEYQLLSGSLDSTIKLWDIRMGKCPVTLTHHKKSIRSIALHPTEAAFASCSSDSIKQWREIYDGEFPVVKFANNCSAHRGIINCLAISPDNIMASGGNDGSLHLWDWQSSENFQSIASPVQPGSLDAEAGIFAMAFDHSGSRLISCEADKTIKMWKTVHV